MNPAVAHFYSAQKKVLLSVHATIFEKHGWTAPKRVYYGTFEPETGWANKSKGLVYIMYEDEKKRLKSDLSDLAKHGLRILVQDSDCSSPPAQWIMGSCFNDNVMIIIYILNQLKFRNPITCSLLAHYLLITRPGWTLLARYLLFPPKSK